MRLLKKLMFLNLAVFSASIVFAEDIGKAYEQYLTSGEKAVHERAIEPSLHRNSANIQIDERKLFPLCALFSYATRHDDGKALLIKNGWELKFVTFDKTPKEIEDEIKTEHSFKQDPNFTPLSEQIKKLNNKSLTHFFGECEENLKESWNIKQHYGFILGEKEIDKRKVYVIAFRGTDDLYSWFLTDFMCIPTKFLGAYVHTGFKWHTEACLKTDELQKRIKKIQNDIRDNKNPLVIITGHSLGAATAVLVTAYLGANKYISEENIHLVALAEPFPGRRSFVTKYSKKIPNYTLIINRLDPVPLATWATGYRHLKGNVIPFWKAFKNIADLHLIGTYKKYIEENFSR